MKISLLLFLLFALTAGSCREENLQALLGITFFHAFEDDRDGLRAYRPVDYPFPPARGRVGFRLEEKNVFVSLDIAPTDGQEARQGSWKLVQEKPLIVEIQLPARASVPGSKAEQHRWEVVSFQDSLLLIKALD
ncbi:MAG: hypothetical protein ACFCUI_00765 [Bernardetiaceae bacterium]